MTVDQRTVRVADLAGAGDVMAAAKITSRSTFSSWRQAGRIPPPLATVAGVELWDLQDVREHLREHGGRRRRVS